MYYRLIQLLILGYYIIHLTESLVIVNSTNTTKLYCYSCKGSHCETIANEEDNVIVCNKHTQLCWAGFVDQQPYRTCASRYCTPSGISLDNDIRIETCCHASLCNTVPLSWSIWSKWYRKSTTYRPETSTTKTTGMPTRQTTTRSPPTTLIYIVNEIVNNERKSSTDREQSEGKDDSLLPKLRFNASDPDSFGITWERVAYRKGFSNRVVSISKFLVLLMPVLLVVLF